MASSSRLQFAFHKGEHEVLRGNSAALASVLADEPVAVSRWRALKPCRQ
jgi:hypothetical protein